ncbi:hypothetical protein C7N43_31565 [Sphingobacteriales bacterium UPWRP_1]|nr:hypothetical protein B6N25_15485 [Sphingobacteriales bacterium TSM_CSS]PSJ72966.1 hypothetical protein C7N43_31565 [Sphingobacteriales bacterium UPWRP_1]
MSHYVNPYTDYGFKRLFGEEANKDLLTDFLNQLLPPNHQITELGFKNNEQIPEFSEARKAFFDIHCQTVSGDQIIVEMQKAKINYFKDRSLFYVTFPIREQSKKGDWDFKLPHIYFIAILDFEYDETEERRKFLRSISLRDEEGELFYDKLHFKFLQMPLFKKTEEELSSHFDKWIYFLKNLESFDKIPEILREPIFERAFDIAALARLNPQQYQQYQNSLLSYLEMKEVVKTAFDEGVDEGIEIGKEQGIEIGKEQGIEIGKEQALLQIARNMKAAGISADEIAKITGLPVKEVDKL